MRPNSLKALWLLLLPAITIAANDISPEPVLIEAERMELDQRHGSSHYQGKVNLQQGGLQMTADSLTLYSKKQQLQRVVAKGSPATLQRDQEGEKGALRAEAAVMEYLPQSQVVILQGSAKLWQDGNEFSGEKIHYNLQQRQFKASSKDGEEKSRVRVLLQPAEQGATEKQP